LEDELEELGHYADWSLRLQLDSCLRQDIQTGCTTHSATRSRHPRLFFSGIKGSGREADRSRIGEVMNAYSHRRTSIPPYVFTTSRFIKH